MPQDLRSFLAMVERDYPEQFLRIREPVEPVYEATALVMQFETAPVRPVLFFEQIRGHAIPLVVNVLASHQRLALALGVPQERLAAEYGARIKNPIPPVLRDDSPLFETVQEGDEVDVTRLPALTHFEQDGGPYITAGHIVARDPLSGVETLGYHRVMVKGPRKLGISLHSRRRMFEYHRRAEELNRPLPAAIVLGVHPLLSMTSGVIPASAELGKFSITGGLLGEPLEVVRGRTIDLTVPRWAEIVIEGHIQNGVREKEGPFGEFTGYASSRGTENVFIPTAVLARRDAIYQSHNAGHSYEHCMFLSFPREALVADVLRRTIPNVRAVHVPIRSGTGSFHVYVSLRKTMEGQPKQAIMSVLGADHYFKLVVVVDEDVNVFDEQEVLWAIATRFQADRDLVVVDRGAGTVLDPSSPDGTCAKLGIDATRPLDKFASRLSMPQGAVQRAREILRGLRTED